MRRLSALLAVLLAATPTYALTPAQKVILLSRAPATPFVGPLDGLPAQITSVALRRLNSAYVANKSTDVRCPSGTNGTVGFTSKGDYNTSTFNTLANGGACFVSKGYDQSGNGNDVSQATAANQPTITLNAANGHATISASAHSMGTAGSVVRAQPLTVSVVAQTTNAASGNILVDDSTRGIVLSEIVTSGTVKLFSNDSAGPTFTASTRHVGVSVFNGASSQIIVDQGTPVSYTDTNDFLNGVMFLFGSSAQTLPLIGDMPEVIIFASALSAGNLTTLQANQKTYYGTP